MNERIEILNRMKKLRAEILQLFVDADVWNTVYRKPDERIIDPDPDGKLKRLADALEKSIGNEERILNERRN